MSTARTTTVGEIKTLAAVRAGRADDASQTSLRFTPAEAGIMRVVIAEDLKEFWEREAWPDLCDNIEEMTLTDGYFSKRVGDADEMGDILAVLAGGDPTSTTAVRTLQQDEYTEFEDRVLVVASESSVWVDWQTPAPELLDVASGSLDAYTLPLRFRSPLAWTAAAALVEDESAERAERYRARADRELNRMATRVQRPWWRRGTLKI